MQAVYKPPLKRAVEGFFSLYSSQPISQGVTLLFFFTEKKKRSKKRKEFAFHLYYKVKYHTKITHQQNSPGGVTGGLSAVTLPFLHLKLGRKVSGDPPLSLLKRKKEAKKEKSSRFTCTTRSSVTRRLHEIFLDFHQQRFPGGAYRRLPPP